MARDFVLRTRSRERAMSELNLTLHRRGQLAAIATLRWRIFVNSLRSTRGKMELASRVIVGLAFAIGGIGGALGMGGSAWYFVSRGKAEYLAVLLWPVFVFWQVFPVMATAFTNNPDSSDLLRFPLSYRSYFLVRLAYGSLDPATAIGSLWLFGILLGIGVASPALLPWALLVLLVFAAFNLLFMQMVFAWVERWLAQRRTREIMGILFILLMLSLQLIGPVMEHFRGRTHPGVRRFIEILVPMQGTLPPGLAADAIAQVSHDQFMAGLSSLLLLGTLTMAMGYLLHLRLRNQFRGENLSEAGARRAVEKVPGRSLGWNLPGFSQAVAAVFEKEVRYLGRSGPMLLTLVMPIFMLVIFRIGPMGSAQGPRFFARAPTLAFPGTAGYALLMLTNLVYNNFGGDAGGIQFFYASPVPFRHVVLAKNLTHASILIFDMALAWLAVTLLYSRPAVDVTIATLAGLLFAAPLNFAVGNLLSLYSPKKLDYSTFGRQRASQMTVLVSLGVQIVVVGIGVSTFVIARHYGNLWIATLFFLGLAVISTFIYGVTLRRIDNIALDRRETLVSELCRA
jgi:ABC-2 type transport system permease protein